MKRAPLFQNSDFSKQSEEQLRKEMASDWKWSYLQAFLVITLITQLFTIILMFPGRDPQTILRGIGSFAIFIAFGVAGSRIGRSNEVYSAPHIRSSMIEEVHKMNKYNSRYLSYRTPVLTLVVGIAYVIVSYYF